jgi:hypothetical protein
VQQEVAGCENRRIVTFDHRDPVLDPSEADRRARHRRLAGQWSPRVVVVEAVDQFFENGKGFGQSGNGPEAGAELVAPRVVERPDVFHRRVVLLEGLPQRVQNCQRRRFPARV